MIINPYIFLSRTSGLTFVGSNTFIDGTANANNFPVNLPTGYSPGDLLLIFFGINANSGTLSDPAGWNVITSGANTDRYRIWGKIADGSEGSTLTIVNTNNQRAAAISYAVSSARNGFSNSEITVTGAVAGSVINPDPPALAPSWGAAENLWIAIAFASDSGFTLLSYPTDYTIGQANAQASNSGTGTAVTVAARLLNADSEDPGVFVTDTNRNRTVFTMAIRPA